MRSPRKALLLISLTALVVFCAGQTPRRIRIITDNANIRSTPKISAEILAVAVKGALYEVVEHAAAWYAIRMGLDETGRVIYGYIHESMVEPSGETTAPQARAEPPPAAQPQRVPPPPPPTVEKSLPSRRAPADKEAGVPARDRPFSGLFLKGGFNDHWVASFGYDFGAGRFFGIGLETQAYFESLSEIENSLLQLDIFANLKLGFKARFLTFYVGGGIGPDLSFTSKETGDHTTSQLKTRLASHVIAGVAVNLGKIAIVFEGQPTWISGTGDDPDIRHLFFFIGLRF